MLADAKDQRELIAELDNLKLSASGLSSSLYLSYW